jgi:hypothetical protein
LFSKDLPKTGIMLRGECFRLSRWEPPTNAGGFSSSGNWQTPRVNDTTAGLYTRDQGDPDKPRPALTAQATTWPTPTAADCGEKQTLASHQKSLMQAASRFSPPAQTTETDGQKSSWQTRRLNPRFVAMLMGWPPGWTAFDAPVTGLSRYRRQLRCEFLRLASESIPPCLRRPANEPL